MTRRSALLVTGGAGYVGSHVSLALRDAGSPATAAGVIREYGIEAVVHLAGSSSVSTRASAPGVLTNALCHTVIPHRLRRLPGSVMAIASV